MTLPELTATRRYPALDGVRAVAVLLVISWHVSGSLFRPLHGSNGVAIFFVLSGFLITAVGLQHERSGGFRYLPFLLRRALRILPLLYVGLAVYAVAVFVLHLDDRGSEYAHALPWIVGYLPEVPVLGAPATAHGGEGPVPFAAVWSLGIEEKFYLVWPLLAFGAVTLRRARPWTAAVLCAGVWTFTLIGPYAAVRFVSHYAPLLLGCLLACAVHTRRGHRVITAVTHPAAATGAFAAAGVLTWWQPGPVGGIAFQVAVTVVLANLVLRPGSVAARLLSSRPAVLLGILSYALYLFHGLALKVAAKLVGGLPATPRALLELAIGLALAVPACYLLHVTVERPTQRLGRRLTASRSVRIPGQRPETSSKATAPV